MKKAWPARVFIMFLCMVILCSAPAHAVEARASERIQHSAVSLSKKSNGDLSVYFSVRATGKMDVIGAGSVAVQRCTNTGWVTEYTFTPSNTPEIQAENRFQYSAILTYSPLFTGREYRAVVTIYVENVTGVSTQQLISKIVTT